MLIHKDGFKFIIFSIFVTILIAFFSFWASLLFAVITIWMTLFFRNPKRILPADQNVIVSPAEGKVVDIRDIDCPNLSNKKCTRISIFLNIFDVHVTRSPVKGKIVDINYVPGKFALAFLDKASESNERNTFIIKFGHNHKILVTQIAGLVARRIKCEVKTGDNVNSGQNIGIIRFGSRVDIVFDSQIQPLVQIGHKVRVGETALFKLPEEWI